MQEALTRAWLASASCRADPIPWLLTITRREAYRRYARRREEPLPDDAHVFCELAATDDIDWRLDFESLLDQLTVDDRRLLELRYGDDMTQPAVAKALGLPEGTTKVRLHRLRLRLRTALEIPDA